MDSIAYLSVPLLQGFEWFDDGLQASLQARGWPALSAAQSRVWVHAILHIVRPAQIARSMGLTRQAVHVTIGQVVQRGILELLDDPDDRRGKIVSLTSMGKAMRRDAQLTVKYCAEQLAARIGAAKVENLQAAFATDWGAPVIRPVDPSEREAVRRRLRQAESTGIKSLAVRSVAAARGNRRAQLKQPRRASSRNDAILAK